MMSCPEDLPQVDVTYTTVSPGCGMSGANKCCIAGVKRGVKLLDSDCVATEARVQLECEGPKIIADDSAKSGARYICQAVLEIELRDSEEVVLDKLNISAEELFAQTDQ